MDEEILRRRLRLNLQRSMNANLTEARVAQTIQNWLLAFNEMWIRRRSGGKPIGRFRPKRPVDAEFLSICYAAAIPDIEKQWLWNDDVAIKVSSGKFLNGRCSADCCRLRRRKQNSV